MLAYVATFVATSAALFVVAAAASAEPATVENNPSVSMGVQVYPCNTPEVVTTEGRLRVVRRVGNDGTTRLHLGYHGVGVGQVSGTRYTLNFVDTVVDMGEHYTQTYRAQLISKGKTDNILVSVTWADGKLMSKPDKAMGKCVGQLVQVCSGTKEDSRRREQSHRPRAREASLFDFT